MDKYTDLFQQVYGVRLGDTKPTLKEKLVKVVDLFECDVLSEYDAINAAKKAIEQHAKTTNTGSYIHDVRAQPIHSQTFKIHEVCGRSTMEKRLEMIIDNIRSDFVRLLNDHEMNAERFLSQIERAIMVSRRYI